MGEGARRWWRRRRRSERAAAHLGHVLQLKEAREGLATESVSVPLGLYEPLSEQLYVRRLESVEELVPPLNFCNTGRLCLPCPRSVEGCFRHAHRIASGAAGGALAHCLPPGAPGPSREPGRTVTEPAAVSVLPCLSVRLCPVPSVAVKSAENAAQHRAAAAGLLWHSSLRPRTRGRVCVRWPERTAWRWGPAVAASSTLRGRASMAATDLSVDGLRSCVDVYCSCYCEENAIRLSRALGSVIDRELAFVVFISNPTKTTLVCHQRGSAHGPPEAPPGPAARDHVVWDYHVVLVAPRRASSERAALVWDLDSRLPFPARLGQYMDACFPQVDPSLDARFRIVPLRLCEVTFASDRRHARDDKAEGGWAIPPPRWPALNQGGSSAVAAESAGTAGSWQGAAVTAIAARAAALRDGGWEHEGSRHSLPCFWDTTTDDEWGDDASVMESRLRGLPQEGAALFPCGLVASNAPTAAKLLKALVEPLTAS